MSFCTVKFSFKADLLPGRFAWLRHHRGWISFDLGEGIVPQACVFEQMNEIVARWLGPVMEQASEDEFDQIMVAFDRVILDWTSSAFEVFEINVEWERFVAQMAGSNLGEPGLIAVIDPTSEGSIEMEGDSTPG